ncbi:hypothetical protein PDESU_03313 [Pontiella desulfatans]|uniref:Uncharacterized protein n=2 Tax=Pontiella desulfatans TaxID=2750659 RepID=A0A6C2U5H2_PONDE|nr:hypothetical protein PDESU_03313 [Pontiella desulfatans]
MRDCGNRVARMRGGASVSVVYDGKTAVDATKGLVKIDPDMAFSGLFSAYELSVWFSSHGMGEIKPNRLVTVDGTEYSIIAAEKDPYGARWQLDLKAIDG